MKWYEWLIVVALVFVSNVGTLYLAKEYFSPKIKVVDLLALGLYTQKDLYERVLAGEDPKKLEREVLQKSQKLQEYLRQKDGLILIKQCVIGGQVEDITNEVANYLRTN